MIPVSSCYAGSLNKYNFLIKVEVFQKVVTGSLAYQFYEKDKRKGALEGVLNGDTLVADFKFMSEGT